MKKMMLGIGFALFTAAQAFAEQGSVDVVINANNLEYSPDLTQVTLKQPKVTLKQETGDTTEKPISLEELVSFWDPKNDSEGNFDDSNPNATLSAWDAKKNYLESSFAITNVEDNEGTLTLTVQGFDKTQPAAPVSINSKVATQDQLQAFTSAAKEASVTILIDCVGNVDGRCHH